MLLNKNDMLIKSLFIISCLDKAREFMNFNLQNTPERSIETISGNRLELAKLSLIDV